jgi:hypothetical protein
MTMLTDDDDLLDNVLAFEKWKDRAWKAYFARHGTAVGFAAHLHQLIDADPKLRRFRDQFEKLGPPVRRLQ